jgi:hypothetical protein
VSALKNELQLKLCSSSKPEGQSNKANVDVNLHQDDVASGILPQFTSNVFFCILHPVILFISQPYKAFMTVDVNLCKILLNTSQFVLLDWVK